MKVTLKTRCGCTRELNMPYPPQRHIRVPLYRQIRPFTADSPEFNPKPTSDVRLFELQSCDGPTATYYEQESQ